MKPLEALLTAIILAGACDLSYWNGRCAQYCKNDGYDTGAWQTLNDSCYCMRIVPKGVLGEKRYYLGDRPRENTKSQAVDTHPTSSFPWSF